MASKIMYLALAICATTAVAASAIPETRIVGGSPTTIEEFPYIVALVYFYPGPGIYVQRCVGSLISSWHVLTTSFCFIGANLNYMLIRAGSTNSLNGGVLSTVRDVIKHPNYVEAPRQADIAVVVLNFPVSPSDTIGILYLPPLNWYIPDGTSVKIVSWGFESEQGPQLETLKTVNLNKLPLADCQAVYADSDAVVIEDPVICASQPGPIGMCLGDSGAPMVIQNVVVGLASYYQGCGDNAWPDVFTRIDRYTDWILDVAVAPSASSNFTNVKVAVPTI
ncbi:trypsin, alkaline C-like [Pectinophora gossypiella]|uniref:trypsin, alkaline C-like n=1 Tax=Pectinophora gossypiella TaxID=13191 RepID=UPI00214F5FB0|nr:trypsin, alkaline C-like [Pectinophora gossypiella]